MTVRREKWKTAQTALKDEAPSFIDSYGELVSGTKFIFVQSSKSAVTARQPVLKAAVYLVFTECVSYWVKSFFICLWGRHCIIFTHENWRLKREIISPQGVTEVRGGSGILSQSHWYQSPYSQLLPWKASMFIDPTGYFSRDKSRTCQWIEHISFFFWMRTEGTKIEMLLAEKNNLHLPTQTS